MERFAEIEGFNGGVCRFYDCALTYIYVNAREVETSFITDATGNATQHLQYLSFGETFVDQQNGYDSRYTFSAKEKPACRNASSGRDDETQYSYFGARYYDSDLSVWLSVDPMAEKYPSISPYAYCAGNPVMLRDPNGMDIIVTSNNDGETETYNYTPGESYLGNNEFISKTVDNMNQIYATDKGKGKIDKLDEKGFLLNIKEADGVRNNGYKRDEQTSIQNYGELYADADGWIMRDGVFMDELEGLAHEIQHAYNDVCGTAYNKYTWESAAVSFQNYITSVYDKGSIRRVRL